MEAVSQVIGPVINILVGYITRQVRYVTSSTTHVTKLRNRMKDLKDIRDHVKQHKNDNERNNLEIPRPVSRWLKEVEIIEKEVNSITSNGHTGCFNIKERYQATKNAMEATEKIESLIKRNSEVTWSDAPKPLGRIDSKPAHAPAPSSSSSSAGVGDTQTGFESRNVTFNHALKLLKQDDHNTQVIALCGMGGLGKTTMMEQLKDVATDKKMFNWILKIVVGRDPSMYSIQNAIAENTGGCLSEMNETVRADLLCKRFKKISEDKQTILIILDDVWEKVDLKGIGLTSPLPNGFKLLLTSRDANVCKQIAVDAVSGLTVVALKVLEDAEAHSLFSRITEISKDNDVGKYKISCDIIKKCGGLPLAIKLIATTLKYQETFAWIDTRDRLKNNDLDKNVQEIIEISYNYLGEEEREIFLLCGLFPEDFNIQIEDLTRYAWGLRLLKEVYTLGMARNRTRTCVKNLKNANLLIDGDNDYSGSVKMHDIVLAFVVGFVRKGNEAWVIEHGDMSRWNQVKKKESCKCVSLACNGGSKFPSDFKFPNPSVLKLMQGDKSLSFPDNFYEEMRNLEVIAYDEMKYPSVSASSHCFPNLRTLCLHKCSLVFDCSSIGNLSNLEVLSFASSGIQKLPSTISNLKKLRLLDITGSVNLIIVDGTLKSLVKLEELYMRLGRKKKGFKFTGDIWKEVAEISCELSTLEIELFENDSNPTNMSFDKLESFKISVGCYLEEENEKMRSHENTLKLVTNRNELLESRMNKLFEKTEVLYLEVDGMIDLEDVDVKPLRPRYLSYCNLRVLVVSGCKELRCLFKLNVATFLSNLEHLKIKNCPVMEELIHIESNEAQAFTFPKMKSLTLSSLPKFTSIFPINKLATCSVPSDISALQPFFNEQVVIPKLEILWIDDMENLKAIWPHQFNSSEEVNVSMLREIKVTRCVCLKNLFPNNPMSLLHHLEKIDVERCGSIEVLIDIDIDRVGEVMEGGTSSRLRSIEVVDSRKLKEIWRVNGVNNSDIIISGFEAVEIIRIKRCERFRNVFTPITSNFDLKSLTNLSIDKKPIVDSRQEQKINIKSMEEEEEISRRVSEDISNFAFPSFLVHNFYHLHKLKLKHSEGVDVVFEIESRELATTQITKQPLQLLPFPYLEDLSLRYMDRMSHVWKCKSNWKEFLILQHQQPPQPLSFRNLTTIHLRNCKSIKYLFSPLMAPLLSNLNNVYIEYCDGIEEVVSSRDDEEEEDGGRTTFTSPHKTTTFFPHLHSLFLIELPNLKHIGGGDGGGALEGRNNTSICHQGRELPTAKVVPWSLCQYSRVITIENCGELTSAIPSYAVAQMQKLQRLYIYECTSMMEVFETQGNNNNNHNSGVGSSTNFDKGIASTVYTSTPLTPRLNVPQLSLLKDVIISGCPKLQYVITFSTLKSLKQLEELRIGDCNALKVIVKEEIDGGETTEKGVVFPRLKSIKLVNLPELVGLFMGMNDFEWPSLEEVVIKKCPQIKRFTGGHSSAPKLQFMHTELGKHSLECGLNFHLIGPSQQTPFSSSNPSSSCPVSSSSSSSSLEGIPWSFHNLIELDVVGFGCFTQSIIPSNKLLQLHKLEKIHISSNPDVEEVFEALNERNSGSSESQTTLVTLPNLTQVDTKHAHSLKYIWKSNEWTVFEFPNLTTLSITYCRNLEHVFTCSMVGSLLKLQYLHISYYCEKLEVIVKEEEEEEECDGAKVKEVVVVELPCLKSLLLTNLPALKGFCLGKKAFSLPSLDTLEIMGCPELTVFTKGGSTTPNLKIIDTSFGRCNVNEDLNSFINEKRQQRREF